MEHQSKDILRKILNEKANLPEQSPEEEHAGFDLNTAGPLDLQQVIGNRATQSMFSGPDSSTGSPKFIQTKLTVTSADDAYEAEADAVAKDVVSQSAQRQAMEEEEPLQAKRVQRMEEEEELQAKRVQRMEDEELLQGKRVQRVEDDELLQGKRVQRMEEEEEAMQAKRIQRANNVDMQDAFSVGGGIEEQIKNSSGGQPMSKDTRADLESGMGYDFSNVNIHHNAQSDTLSRSLQARAFTYGNDIYFRQGEYNPDSTSGKELLAHELTHTVQQGAVSAKREDD